MNTKVKIELCVVQEKQYPLLIKNSSG